MKNLATKSLIVLLGLVSLVLGALIVLGVYHIKNKSIQTSETAQKVEEGSSNALLVQSINSTGKNSDNELAKLENLGLSQEKLVGFIETLEGLGKIMNLSVTISSVESEPGKGPDNPDKIHFKIEAVGSWNATMQFLNAAEHLPYRIMIGNANLSAVGNVDNAVTSTTTAIKKNNWKLVADLAAYSFK